MKQYDVIIIGAGPGGIYSAWEMAMKKPELKIAVFEKGRELEKRKCPINGDTVKNCVGLSFLCHYEWFWWSRCIFRW